MYCSTSLIESSKRDAALVDRFYALGDDLADFKTVHSLRERAVYFSRTHDKLLRTGDVAWGAELVRSEKTAVAEQVDRFLV